MPAEWKAVGGPPPAKQEGFAKSPQRVSYSKPYYMLHASRNPGKSLFAKAPQPPPEAPPAKARPGNSVEQMVGKAFEKQLQVRALPMPQEAGASTIAEGPTPPREGGANADWSDRCDACGCTHYLVPPDENGWCICSTCELLDTVTALHMLTASRSRSIGAQANFRRLLLAGAHILQNQDLAEIDVRGIDLNP